MKMTSSELDYEIERLKAEIAQEKQQKLDHIFHINIHKLMI